VTELPPPVHIEEIRRAVTEMREATTTVTGLVLAPPVAAVLVGWLEAIASAEVAYYQGQPADALTSPQPLDAAHGAWTISRAYLTGATEEVPGA
jgi:hypothetical protein